MNENSAHRITKIRNLVRPFLRHQLDWVQLGPLDLAQLASNLYSWMSLPIMQIENLLNTISSNSVVPRTQLTEELFLLTKKTKQIKNSQLIHFFRTRSFFQISLWAVMAFGSLLVRFIFGRLSRFGLMGFAGGNSYLDRLIFLTGLPWVQLYHSNRPIRPSFRNGFQYQDYDWEQKQRHHQKRKFRFTLDPTDYPSTVRIRSKFRYLV